MDGEREHLESARDDLIKLLRDKELRFYQRAEATDVLLGDNNTRYFHMVANGKHRKKHIPKGEKYLSESSREGEVAR